MILSDLVTQAAVARPDAPAVMSSGERLTYRELDRLANRMAHVLSRNGVEPGDRVGIWLPKSAHAVALMQAVLRLGAIYVPLDPYSPAARIRTMVRDCAMRALVSTSARFAELLAPELDLLVRLELDALSATEPDDEELAQWLAPLATSRPAVDDCAYILYTSGSTGTPKGVRISHRNALAFIYWAVAVLGAGSDDRFANHAPFHFDISVLDLYGAFAAGASVILIPETAGYYPGQMVQLIADERVTIWYSVPSALILMMERGNLLASSGLALRAILFAGEVFPIRKLQQLMARFAPPVRLLNLYGPTETNVCTYYELGPSDMQRDSPVPIGRSCCGNDVWVRRDDGSRAGTGEIGELVCAGPTVMLGYWNGPEQGERPYATGDLAYQDPDGNYIYAGRRDRMVKIRGHRVELGDIESALYLHPAVREAAVVATGSGLDAKLIAFVAPAASAPPTLLGLKQHCAQYLPAYMIIDLIRIVPELPRSRNGKLDRMLLQALESSTNPSMSLASQSQAQSHELGCAGRDD